MVNWIQGDLPEEVTAMLTNVMHDNSEVEDLSIAVLRYRDASLAQVTSSVVHHGEEQGIELQCADAKIAAPWDVKAELSRPNGFPIEGGNKELISKLEDFYKAIPDLLHEGHSGQIEDIINALENGTRPLITGIDGRKTIELITAIYKAGCKKEVVQLPLAKDDDFYTFDGLIMNAVKFYEKGKAIENLPTDDISVGKYK
jgi:predicted dehydrogenase